MAEKQSRPGAGIITLIVVGLLALVVMIVAMLQLRKSADEVSNAPESTSVFHQNLSSSQYPTADPASLGYDPAILDDMHGGVFNPPVNLQDFEAPSTTGEPFRLSDQAGRVVLVYFGYMNCPDYCPATLADLERVQRELGDLAERVQVIMVTVDPERDTIDRLIPYMRAFDESFIGLRFEDAAAMQTLLNQFGIVASRVELENSALEYSVEHTVGVFMIDPHGNWVQRFLYDTPHENIAADVRLMLESMDEAS